MAVKTQKNSTRETKADDGFQWPYGRKNYLVFGLALIFIIIGYLALGMGSITLAPILLVIGYCVLIPIALIIKGTPQEENTAETDSLQ